MIAKLVDKLREGGPRLLLHLVIRNAAHLVVRWDDWRFDRTYGVDTTTPVLRPDLVVEHPHLRFGTSYHATTISALKRIFGSLSIDHRQYEFVEFGAGKGRVLLWAARHPFLRVTGVEYSDLLCAVAERNVARISGRREFKAPIAIVCQDAADFEVPSTPCVFYFYNPFSDEIASKVFGRIVAARRSAPRPDVVVWYPDSQNSRSDLPESFGFQLLRRFTVRDAWGANRDVFVLGRN